MTTATDLTAKKCQACEGGIPALTRDESATLAAAVPVWRVSADGKRLVRMWKLKNFVEALDLANRIGQLAEGEGHHPDLHLTGYRMLGVELTTHAVGGLTENDFILAAKIDALGS